MSHERAGGVRGRLPLVSRAVSAFDGVAPPAAAAGTFICVGLSVVVTRYAVTQGDMLTIAFLRNGLAFLLLFPFICRALREFGGVERLDRLWICLLGLSSFAAFPLLFTAALRYTPATHGALALPAVTPILTLSLAAALGRERWTGRKVTGIVFAALGVAAAISDATWMSGVPRDGDLVWLGDLLMVLAAATIAGYNVLTKPLLDRYGALTLLSIGLGVGAGALSALVAVRAVWQGAAWPEFQRPEWVAIMILGIASALSNWLWCWALSRTTATRVAVFIALNPIVAMLGAVLFLGERMTAMLGVGLLLVLAGITLVNRQDPRSADRAPA